MALSTIPPQHTTIDPSVRANSMQVVSKYCTPDFQKHLFAVECAMRALAKHFGGDPDTWGLCGLIHDLDWEDVDKDPELHCANRFREMAAEIDGVNDEVIETVISHYNIRKIPLDTLMKRALFSVDELTGLIAATAKMNPNGLSAVKVKSVKKKFKDKGFAAGVDRELVRTCETNLDMPLEEMIAITLEAMQQCENPVV